MVCDEDATLELRVRTVKYFKVRSSYIVHNSIQYTVQCTVYIKQYDTCLVQFSF